MLRCWAGKVETHAVENITKQWHSIGKAALRQEKVYMWYENLYRSHLLDVHIEVWHPDFLSRFSPETYVENLKRARINYAMIYFQSHVGLCYYPTDTGALHRAFVKQPDQMRPLVDLAHVATSACAAITASSIIRASMTGILNGACWRRADSHAGKGCLHWGRSARRNRAEEAAMVSAAQLIRSTARL